MDKRIIRVFPRWIKNATPVDDMAGVNRGPELLDYAKEPCAVHVSAAFSFDLKRAEELAREWTMLEEAGLMTTRKGGKSHRMRCYVLCGWPADTQAAADLRMRRVMAAGYTPAAMLWMDDKGRQDKNWKKFQKEWMRPAIMHKRDEGGLTRCARSAGNY